MSWTTLMWLSSEDVAVAYWRLFWWSIRSTAATSPVDSRFPANRRSGAGPRGDDGPQAVIAKERSRTIGACIRAVRSNGHPEPGVRLVTITDADYRSCYPASSIARVQELNSSFCS